MPNPINWPNPERPGAPMFPNISGRHVLENKRRRSLKLVLWDHEQEHYCTEVGYMTPGNMVAMDWEYYAPCLTATQIDELLAGERERCAKECERLKPSMDEIIGNSFFGVRGVALVDASAAIRNLGAAP